jgi:transketolase
MSNGQRDLHQVCINTLRILAADAIQEARSGHPGLPLGAASMAYVLWTKFLRYNPANPCWSNRDRFVHSAGHGSVLYPASSYQAGISLGHEAVCNGSKTPAILILS